MSINRPLPLDFSNLLERKEQDLIVLFNDLRAFILEIHPESNELLYHTHALTSVFSVSEKLSDAFCMIPIYTSHLNLGFNKGTLLDDPDQLLTGTGNLIRHIPIKSSIDYRNEKTKNLILSAIEFAIKDRDKPAKIIGTTISKIKK